MSVVGTTLGHIRVVDVLGSGGLGEVYVGLDEKLKRRVALKAIRRGLQADREIRGRFLREARVLSQLDHPNICRIFDFIEGGETDYLVLELIEGTSLRVAIRDGMSHDRAVRVSLQIAEALALAHESGIIHRDLKPDNVMLTASGDVKVLDFGLARLTQEDYQPAFATPASAGWSTAASATAPSDDREQPTLLAPSEAVAGGGETSVPLLDGDLSAVQRTRRGSLMGTLTYMSPEQARGEPVTPASDIYSLGLVLHELFSGMPIHDPTLDSAEVLRRAQIGETPPVVGIDRDVAALIGRMKAVAPAERPSARGVAERLRWIQGRRTRRLRRLALAVAVALLAAGVTKYTLDLRRERTTAVAARAEAEQTIELLVDLFEVSDPDKALGRTITAREVLDRGAARISTELADQPQIRARLALTIARVFENLGLLDDAARLAAEALETRRQAFGEDNLEVAEACHILGDLQRKLGNFEEAEELLTRSTTAYEQLLGPLDSGLVPTLNTLAVLYENWGQLAEAEQIFRRVQDIQQRDPQTQDAARSKVLTNLAVLNAKQGEDEEAEALFREVVAIDERTLGTDHPQLAVSYSNLGIMLKRRRKFDEAAELYGRALAIQERTLPPQHPSLGNTITNLANLALETHDYPRALELYDRAVAIFEETLGPDHPRVALVLDNLGLCHHELGHFAEADRLLRRALAINEKALAPGSPDIGSCLAKLATVQLDLGRPEEARELAQRALAIEEAALGPDDPVLAEPLHCLAVAARTLGRPDQALGFYRRALAIAEANPHADPEELSSLRSELAALEAPTGRAGEAAAASAPAG